MKQQYSHTILIFLDEIYEAVNTKKGCLSILVIIIVAIAVLVGAGFWF